MLCYRFLSCVYESALLGLLFLSRSSWNDHTKAALHTKPVIDFLECNIRFWPYKYDKYYYHNLYWNAFGGGCSIQLSYGTSPISLAGVLYVVMWVNVIFGNFVNKFLVLIIKCLSRYHESTRLGWFNADWYNVWYTTNPFLTKWLSLINILTMLCWLNFWQ